MHCFDWLIEFSHELTSKIQPVVHEVEKTPSSGKERTYDVLYSPYKEKAEMILKMLGKSDISKKEKSDIFK